MCMDLHISVHMHTLTPFDLEVLEKKGGVSQADVHQTRLLVLNVAALQAQGDKRRGLISFNPDTHTTGHKHDPFHTWRDELCDVSMSTTNACAYEYFPQQQM